jgi:hypothetical protein
VAQGEGPEFKPQYSKKKSIKGSQPWQHTPREAKQDYRFKASPGSVQKHNTSLTPVVHACNPSYYRGTRSGPSGFGASLNSVQTNSSQTLISKISNTKKGWQSG